jgi:hypothetical protein
MARRRLLSLRSENPAGGSEDLTRLAGGRQTLARVEAGPMTMSTLTTEFERVHMYRA